MSLSKCMRFKCIKNDIPVALAISGDRPVRNFAMFSPFLLVSTIFTDGFALVFNLH